MERKQGFFSAFKGGDKSSGSGRSPGKSRSKSPARSVSPSSSLIRRRKGRPVAHQDVLVSRSRGIIRPELLSPLNEGPDPEETDAGDFRTQGRWTHWMKCQLPVSPSTSSSSGGSRRSSDLRLLLGVLGAPLAPVHVTPADHMQHVRAPVHVTPADHMQHLSLKDPPIETSSAQYILQQYTAASGGQKLLSSIQNAYVMGRVRMTASEFETAGKGSKAKSSSKGVAESGGFVLWQMNPDMWYVELALGGSKVHAGCNGQMVWRHTPWLGPHAAKGPVRPLRRALQGLDPRTTTSMFTTARCTGEKNINGEDCFILKLCADPATLKARTGGEGPSETIRHTVFGYFSQKTGLLVLLEDSHLTQIQTHGGDPVFWETTINSYLEDYRSVEGVAIAHSGRSVVTLLRFGETATSQTRNTLEEAWVIEEVAFNVPGLSAECFIPPAELRFSMANESQEFSRAPTIKRSVSSTAFRAKGVPQ